MVSIFALLLATAIQYWNENGIPNQTYNVDGGALPNVVTPQTDAPGFCLVSPGAVVVERKHQTFHHGTSGSYLC